MSLDVIKGWSAARRGDALLVAVLVALGVYWTYAAVQLGVWSAGQPQSGFMPLVYGILLVLFSIIALLIKEETESPPVGVLKPLAIVGVVGATVICMPVVGMAAGLFLMMLALFMLVERLKPLKALAVAAAVTGVLFLVFGVWLQVPLPRGPLGI